MVSESQRQKGHDGALGVTIAGLNLAKDTCGIARAQHAFGTVGALLTTIKVRGFLFGDGLPVDVCPGLYGRRPGLRRARAELHRYLQGPRSGNERE